MRVISEMIGYFKNDIKRINHALKVYSFATTISETENLDDIQKKIVLNCGILHDIGIVEAERKYNSSDGKYQEIEGPEIAKNILESIGESIEVIERVKYIIGNHHSYSKIDGLDFQILVEADFLVNIFEDNIDKDTIRKILNKIFKTTKGIELLKSMYL